MALVFQSYALWPHMKVFDNVAFALKLQKRPSDEIKKVAVDQGMRTLRQDGQEKVRLGLTTLEEVLRVVV